MASVSDKSIITSRHHRVDVELVPGGAALRLDVAV
jgi:hypothetical protein